jgi:hypothetical protein
MEMPSFALRAACSRPSTCERILDAIASPAASSAAELILSPVDRRSIAVDIARSFLVIALDASVALTFVLITVIDNSTFP